MAVAGRLEQGRTPGFHFLLNSALVQGDFQED